MKQLDLLVTLLFACSSASCGGQDPDPLPGSEAQPPAQETSAPTEADHAHDEISIGSAAVGELEVELAQGHGPLVAGEQGHLVVKLPYNDRGASLVRAWIGTRDRTQSRVGLGEYAPSHDDYDIHASAPDPLPEGVQWWIEVQAPDGTRQLGSAQPLLESGK